MNQFVTTTCIAVFFVASVALQAKVHLFADEHRHGGLDEHIPAPAFTLKTVDGRSVSLSDFRGHPVVLDFFATSCSPCKQEIFTLKTWRNRRAKHNLPEIPILVISIDQEISDVEHYLKTHDFPFIMLHDGTRKVAELYKVRGVPTVYFIDSNGTIADTTVGANPGMSFTYDHLAEKEYKKEGKHAPAD